jgi:hypothetical protein
MEGLDKTVRLQLIFNAMTEPVCNYLKACRIPVLIWKVLTTEATEDLKRAFRILVTNNQIPVEHFSKLREIVENYTK